MGRVPARFWVVGVTSESGQMPAAFEGQETLSRGARRRGGGRRRETRRGAEIGGETVVVRKRREMEMFAKNSDKVGQRKAGDVVRGEG